MLFTSTRSVRIGKNCARRPRQRAQFFPIRTSRLVNNIYLLTEFEVRAVSYGPSFPRWKIYEVNRTPGKRTAFNFSGHTVKYGPLNWPITTRVLTERYNKYREYELMMTDLRVKVKVSWIAHVRTEHVQTQNSSCALGPWRILRSRRLVFRFFRFENFNLTFTWLTSG